MVAKYRNDMPVWAFVESVSFGTLIDLHKFCADRWGDSELRENHYLLKQVKSVRNAAAHSSNIVNGFAGKGSAFRNYEPVSAALASAGVTKAQRRTKMRVLAMQQIVVTLFTYNRIVVGRTSRGRAGRDLARLKERMALNEGYYANNDAIRSSFGFLVRLFDNWF